MKGWKVDYQRKITTAEEAIWQTPADIAIAPPQFREELERKAFDIYHIKL
jgi:hypothetical protein